MVLNHDLEQSPVEYLLNSNYSPTLSEEETIQCLVEQHEAELEQLASEGSNLESLQEQGAAVAACSLFISKHKALLSLTRNLPTELLQTIFTFHAALPPSVATSTPPALVLSRVCVRWRDVAYSLPEIWGQLPFLILNRQSQKSNTYHQLIESYIERSGSSPLTFSLSDELEFWGRHPILDLIEVYSERWADVSFTASPFTIAPLFQECWGLLPILHTLKLSLKFDNRFQGSPSLISLTAPNLRNLSIHNYMPYITIAWSQLTSYEEHLGQSGGISHLQGARNLERLVVEWKSQYRLGRWTTQICRFHHLKSLTLNAVSQTSKRTFLDWIDLGPVLRELHVRERIPIVKKLIRMIQRSNISKGLPSEIRKLTLQLLAPPHSGPEYVDFIDQLHQLFKLTPLVEELGLVVRGHEELKLLAWSKFGEPLLPRLRELRVQVAYPSESRDSYMSWIDSLEVTRKAYVDSLPGMNWGFSVTFK